ncbi:MAG TPA: Uma2 family endonuclease [Gemmataceae bacterium]|nr:Uma2 family endonuclease [Gemmataceae bacterium]
MQPQQQEMQGTLTAPFIVQGAPRIPPLETGDHLTRDEFERRYEAMPEVKKAELIEGVVYLPSPVRAEQHGNPHADLITWMGLYRASTPGVRVSADASIRLDLDNEPQPDALMYIEPARGGSAQLDGEGYLVGGPELVAEVAASTVSIARNTKLRVYRRNNIREYIIWRVDDQVVDWFVLRQSQYDPLPRAADGVLRSEQFPGLWLNADALLRFDLAGVLQVLQQGLASLEHAAFVSRLQAATAGQP